MLNKLIIVTQTPPSLRKHPGGDRTGDFVPRSKMTAELAKVINDGLYFYEQDLHEQENKVECYLMILYCHCEKCPALRIIGIKSSQLVRPHPYSQKLSQALQPIVFALLLS